MRSTQALNSLSMIDEANLTKR